MIFHPAIIALLASSVLISFLALYSAYYGIWIIRRWDLKSGSSLQLDLERRTYLISTVLAYVFAFQLISLFLFVYTTDSLCTLFTGAMCAAGTLHVNRYGYPVLILKIINFILAGLWLIVNHADNRGYDYPLIKGKYAFLTALIPFLIAEAIFQTFYVLGLHPDVITSCCGSLFSGSGQNMTSDLSTLPAVPMKVLFVLSMTVTLGTGSYFLWTGKAGYFFSTASGASFLIAIASILSFVSLYVYELPTHHCPFCLLQREYGYVGYPALWSSLQRRCLRPGSGSADAVQEDNEPYNRYSRPPEQTCPSLPSFLRRFHFTCHLSHTCFPASFLTGFFLTG